MSAIASDMCKTWGCCADSGSLTSTVDKNVDVFCDGNAGNKISAKCEMVCSFHCKGQPPLDNGKYQFHFYFQA